MRPDRADAALSLEFAKDEAEENFLADLNEALAAHEAGGYRRVTEVWPSVQVVGVPRSGTTMLTQLLAAHLDVACMNNLVAAFWAAPCVGLRLARKLLPANPRSDYRSRYGRTVTIGEPHEFGYFWARLLGSREMREPESPAHDDIDWERVRLVLTNMADAAGRPLLFKSFQLAFYAAEVQQVLPRTCFVHVRRTPLDTALSILKMRREYSGDERHWTSLKPREYSWLADEPVPVQVAGQALFGDRSLRRALARARAGTVLELDYADVCASPRAAVSSVAEMLHHLDVPVARIGEPPKALTSPSRPTVDAADRRAVAAALERLQEQR